MQIILLNWKNGENDPFSLFNGMLKSKFESYGRSVKIVELNSDFDKNIAKTINEGIDFALTWQGIASGLINRRSEKNLWDEYKIPLFCLHGDHPCHKISNHTATSEYIRHIYLAPSFCRYANKFIERTIAAQFMMLPNIFHTKHPSTTSIHGDYFVFPKNLDDTKLMVSNWEKKFPAHIATTFKNIASAIKSEYKESNSLDHHEIIDIQLTEEFISNLQDHLKINSDMSARHYAHAYMDKFYRNLISEDILATLSDVKIQIYGRGWDRFKNNNNKNHSFFSFDKALNGDFQFQSNFGILDVAPINDSIHDRSFRAMASNNGFLIASSWNASEFLNQNFENLFFTGKDMMVRALAELVIQSPESHRASAQQFKSQYHTKYGFHQFLKNIENVAATLNAKKY